MYNKNEFPGTQIKPIDTISLKRIHELKQELDKEIPDAVDKTILFQFFERIVKDMDATNKY